MYEQTGKMPDGLANRPFIEFPWDGYFKSFLKLIRRRQAGFSSGQALTPTDIILWGYTHHFGNDMEFFVRMVTELDDEFLKWEAQKAKEKRDQDTRNKKSRPPPKPRGRR